MFETMLVPTDGSDSANRAVEYGLRLAERYGAILHAMYVVDTRRYGEPALSSSELIVDELEDEGEALLEDLRERSDNRSVEVTGRVCHGAPHEEIAAYADEIDADLIVIGYQGHSHSAKEHMGSVTDRVLRTTSRPVLVV